MTDTTAVIRRRFAESLRDSAPIRNDPNVVEAFASVPRERFVGPRGVPAPELAEIYRDTLIPLDRAKGINNGQPSLWAMVFDRLEVTQGARVFQMGAGGGYYTAILAHLTGPEGHVRAYEIDLDLAARAADALARLPQVMLRHSDATEADIAPFDVGVVCAGVTRLPVRWRLALEDGGRIMLPFTGSDGMGFMGLIRRSGKALTVENLGGCGFVGCDGAREPEEAAALTRALRKGVPRHMELAPGDAPGAWYQGRDFHMMAV